MDAEITVADVPSAERYEIREGASLVGFTEYILPDDEHVDFIHTEIDDAYAGQGMAGTLVHAALDDVRARGKRIIPHCPYVRGYIRKHPEYNDITDWPADLPEEV